MLRTLVSLCLLLSFLGGCAPIKEETEVDRFMEKWQRLAEETKGHSPTPPSTPGDLQDVTFGEQEMVFDIDPPKKERELPQTLISLRMYDTPLPVILATLGRVINQPIMVSPTVQGSSTVSVQNQRWDLVVKSLLANNGLSYEWEGNILRIVTATDIQKNVVIETLKNKRRHEGIIKLRVEPLQTGIVRVRYADAKSLMENLRPLLTKEDNGTTRGSVEAHPYTNSILATAISSDLKKIRKMVEVLDKPRKQVRMMAHIVEATKETARELGTQWGGFYTDKNFTSIGGGSTDNPDLGPGIGGKGLITDMTSFFSKAPNTSLALIGGEIAGNYLELQLKALEEDNKINILSSPLIVTLDNQLAFTESGERVPYESFSENTGTNVEFQDAVLRLEITPHIIDHETLRLKILIKKDEVDTSRNVAGNPYIIKKHTETTLIVRNGETVVITGLSKTRTSKSREGIPYVQDIPGIGRMFAGQDDTDKMEEYLIFIQPTILPQWKPNEKQVTLEDIEKQILQERGEKELADKLEKERKKEERKKELKESRKRFTKSGSLPYD